MATDQYSQEEKEVLTIVKEYAKEFSDFKYILDVFSSSMTEWREIFLLAKEKAVIFEDYLCLW